MVELAHSIEEAHAVVKELGFPAIIRPSFTMGGSGGGIAYNMEEFNQICNRGLDASPTRELFDRRKVFIGWKGIRNGSGTGSKRQLYYYLFH